MADSINSNNPAVDGMGRSYPGIDKSLLQSLMSGKVGDAKAFNSKGTDEVKEEIKKLAKILSSKNADFIKDLQKAVKYIDEMRKVVSSLNEKGSSKKQTSDFGNMANALGKILAPLIKKGEGSNTADVISKAMSSSKNEMKTGFKSMERVTSHLASVFGEFIKMMEPFVDEGLKKGSIFTRDVRLTDKIGKGIKIEKGSIQAWNKQIFSKSGGLTKGFREAFADIQSGAGGGTDYQKYIADAFSKAEELTGLGFSEVEALNKAFKEVGDTIGDSKARKQFKANQDLMIERVRALEKENKILSKEGIANFVGKVGDSLANMATEIMDVDVSLTAIRKDIVDLVKVQNDFKQASFETSGIIKTNAEYQKELALVSGTINETGFEQAKAQQLAVKYQRAGLKLNKDTAKVIKSQLSTEKQLGLEAGTLDSHFKSMSMEAGFSGGQIEQMGRDMANVAKSSGLSGEAMRDVVEKTRELTKLLQASGTLTVDANKNILGFLAEAKKLGVEEGAGEFGKALSGMKEFNQSQNRFLQSAVGQAGMIGKVYNRTLLSDKEGLTKVAEQYQKNLSRQLGKAADGTEIKTYKDFIKAKTKAEMSGNEQEMARLMKAREQIEAATGQSLESALKVPEALLKGVAESSKPLQEKIDEINRKQADGLIEKEAAERQIEKMRAESATSLLTKMTEVAAASDGAAQFTEYLSKKGGQDLIDIAAGASPEEAIEKSLEAVNKRLKESGVKELNFSKDLLKRAVSGGKDGEEAMTEVQEAVMKASREADERDMRKNNPAYEAAQTLKDIKDMLSGSVAGWLGGLNKWVFIAGGVLAAIGGASALVSVWKAGQKIIGSIGNKATAPPPAPPPNLAPAPAPPPKLDDKGKTIAPAPPPNTDEKGKKVKGATTVVTPHVDAGETKGKDAAKPKKGKGTAAPSTKSKGFEFEEKLPTGRKSMWQKTKSFGSGVKGKIGGLFSGGAALAGGLAETAVNALGGGGDEGGGCACSIAESALSQVGSLAGVATDAASATAEAALDATKKTGKNVANVADDAAKGAAKGAAKSAAKATAGVADDAVKAAGQSAGLMSKATGFLGKTVGFLGKAAGPLASVAGAGIEIAAGGDVKEAVSGGVGGLIGGALGGAAGALAGPLGAMAAGAVGAYVGDWLGRMGSEYLPGIWEGAKNVASTLWEGARNVGSNIASSIGAAGSWAGDKISGAASWAGDKISGAASAVGDAAGWAGDKISGAASAVANSTVGKAVGGAASWAGDKISGAASSVGSAASAGWSKFTGWLGFAEGAREIENSGLAMLHKGEVIFPMEIVKSLVAKGTSSFGSLGGFLENVGGGLTSAASKFTESGGVTGLLGSAATKLGSTIVDSVGGFFGSTSKMQGEMANAEMKSGSDKAATVSTSGSSMLSAIATASESQVTVSKEIRDILRDMLSNMINSNAGMGGEGENYVGMSTNRDAFKAPIGNINDGAVKNVSQIAYG